MGSNPIMKKKVGLMEMYELLFSVPYNFKNALKFAKKITK